MVNISHINLKLAKAIVFLLVFIFAGDLFAARIKDSATIEGSTETQVIGYGLVTGLNNTGDNQRTSFTVQSVSNMLKRFGLTVPQTNPRIRNVAAVMVTANIPTFSSKGSKIDVQVSSIGDATSLQGGILILTPLSAQDGSIVGMAQGAVSVGGYDYRSMGSRVGRNFVTSGRVPNSLILEKPISGKFLTGNKLRIILNEPDFTTSTRIAQAVQGSGNLVSQAVAVDAGNVEVTLSGVADMQQVMQTITAIEALNVESDPVARVVINERTGTVVVGGNVQILPSVVAHGGLEISIQKRVFTPQGVPFSPWIPSAYESSELQVNEEISPSVVVSPQPVAGQTTVAAMADALNRLNVSPRDLIAIFQALKESGALQGELIIQ